MGLLRTVCKHIHPLSSPVIHRLHMMRSASFSMSSTRFLDQDWRKMNSLPENPNKEKVLLELPDYSFLDKRPVPYGSKQKQRIEKQMEYTAKIIKLTEEIDFAVRRHQQLLKEKDDSVKATLDRKLKPKGDKLLKS